MLEAGYKNKFPPIGLMKLAYYHTHCRGDLVWFAKGKLSDAISEETKERIRASPYYQTKYRETLDDYLGDIEQTIVGGGWDRVYVTTLFTYEWTRTVEIIEYAKTLVKDSSHVLVGGVAATLMSRELEGATGIKPKRGLILDSSQLGYEPGTCVDTLIPDYSILEHTEYRYSVSNGYFLTATRGCGNRCSFCAVQTLEPDYQDYIPILPRIEKIRKLYGDKRHLYLLDNNVLRSSCFEKIIEDIKAAGYGRGATWLNPATGKYNRCHVDFNQGLDSKFLTEDKARLLGEIALDPAHIAFDHIDERERYLKAIQLMDKYGINNISSYLLYNTKNFAGKGSHRKADTPRDLYDRMRINYDVNKEINRQRREEGKPKFDAFAFPMCFVPLNSKNRDFVGDNWTPRLLAGIRTMLQPSRGGVYVTPGYFEHMYGSCYEDFRENLLLPHEYIRHKGKPADKYVGEHPNKKWLLCIEEWKTRYRGLSESSKEQFETIIADNHFTVQTLLDIQEVEHQLLYLHYFTGTHLPDFLNEIRGMPAFTVIQDYILYRCPSILWCSLEMLAVLKNGSKKVGSLMAVLFSADNVGDIVASF